MAQLLASKYKQKRELLISGYTFEASEQINVPIVILKQIERCHSEVPQLIVTPITKGFPLYLECYIKGELNHLLDIKKYKLIFTDFDNLTQDNMISELQQSTDRVYDTNNLCYAIFQLDNHFISNGFKATDYFLNIMRKQVVKIKYKLLAYNKNDEIVEAKNEIQWNIVATRSPRPRITLNRIVSNLEFAPLDEKGCNWIKFQSELKKALTKKKYKIRKGRRSISKKILLFYIIF